LSGLGSGDLSISTTAHGVVAGSAGVGSTIGFSSWLDPDDGIDVRRAGAGGWAGTETSVLDVAPVTPGSSDVLLTGTALINDELSAPSAGSEHRSQGVDVVDLVVVVVTLGDWVGGSSAEGVVVGNVGGKTTDVRRFAGTGPDLSEHGSSRADVGWPSEPSSVTSIDVALKRRQK
jgi:hypothetical protein